MLINTRLIMGDFIETFNIMCRMPHFDTPGTNLNFSKLSPIFTKNALYLLVRLKGGGEQG